jgi:radical SAM protein with 4Fe4S-binding SPASM domain
MQHSTFPCLDAGAASTRTIALRSFFLHMTKACNLLCSYCYFAASKPLPDEMSTEEYSALWPVLVALCPQKIIFTGGEPLLRPDILDLLYGLRAADPEHRVLRCLNTNGHLVTPELARAMVGLVDEVRVSLDGLAKHNDVQRGQGNFEAAVQALDTFYTVGFEPKVLVTVTAQSLPDLEELLCFLTKEKKIRRININPFCPIGRGRGYLEWQVNEGAVRDAIRRAWERCFPGQLLPEPPEVTVQHHCGVGHFLNILPNGDVFPCHVLTDRAFRCGNVREQSLLEICQHNGLLGKLAALDFVELARQDERVAALTHPHTCMGCVYAQTKSLPIWSNVLPLSSVTRAK